MEIQTCALDVWRGRVFICRFISSPPSWSFYKHLSRGIQADDRSTLPASWIISMQNSAIQHPDTMMLFLISSTSSFLQVRIFSSSRCPAKTMSSSAIKYELFPPLQLREKTLNVFRQAWKSRVGIIGQHSLLKQFAEQAPVRRAPASESIVDSAISRKPRRR